MGQRKLRIAIAGAGNVLATLWPVDLSVSRFFIDEFYAALLNRGDVPEAARAAAITFIEDGAPLQQWCGFVVSGAAVPTRKDVGP